MLTTVALGTVAAGASGTAVGVQDLKDSYVQLTGTFSATWYVDISGDGTNWAPFDTGSAAKLVGPIPHAVKVRLRVGAGSGSVVGVLGADDGVAGATRSVPLGPVAHDAGGVATNISDLRTPYAIIAGTFSATWTLKFSTDGGTTWVTIDTGTAAKVVGPLPDCGLAKIDLGTGTGSVTCSIVGRCYEATRKRNADPGKLRGGVVADLVTATNSALVKTRDLQRTQVYLYSADFVGTYNVQVTMNDGTAYVNHTSTAVESGATAVTVTLPPCTGFRVGASVRSAGTLSTAWSGPAARQG